MLAIETHYAGCRFRSRLEARWAYTQGWTAANLTAALTQARSARFEHGETPR